MAPLKLDAFLTAIQKATGENDARVLFVHVRDPLEISRDETKEAYENALDGIRAREDTPGTIKSRTLGDWRYDKSNGGKKASKVRLVIGVVDADDMRVPGASQESSSRDRKKEWRVFSAYRVKGYDEITDADGKTNRIRYKLCDDDSTWADCIRSLEEHGFPADVLSNGNSKDEHNSLPSDLFETPDAELDAKDLKTGCASWAVRYWPR